MANTVYHDIMVPIGIGLMIIWFLVTLTEKATHDQFNFEQMFMLFAKLIAAKYIIDNGMDLFMKMWDIGISLASSISYETEVYDTAKIHQLWEQFFGKSWNQKLGIAYSIYLLLQLLIPWVAAWVLSLAVRFICVSRMIEVYIRMMFAPIAVSDFMTEGTHGTGWRFLKSFFAICLQGAMLIAIGALYSALTGESLSHLNLSDFSGVLGLVNYTLETLIYALAALALMFKSLSLSKEIVGVG